jgi:molybdopterin-guanine dinucleotide biosynthesis protein A
MSDAVVGAVLVGGASRRMGQDKRTLTLRGTPLAHRVRRVLFDAGVGSVVLVGAADGEEGTIPDGWPGEGPLGGLATAMLHGAAIEGVEVVVVAACDQPDLTPELLAALVRAVHGAADGTQGAVGTDAAVGAVARTSDGRRHPFPSAWRVGAAEPLRALVEAGERRADAAFGLGPVVEVPATEAAVVDLDTPADVEAWLRERGDGPEPS